LFGPAGKVRNAKHSECRVFTLFDVAAKSLEVVRGFVLYLGIVLIWRYEDEPMDACLQLLWSSEYTDSWIPLSCNDIEGYHHFLINPHLPNDCQLLDNQWPHPCQVVHPDSHAIGLGNKVYVAGNKYL
jgi:hypothetical protein